MTEVNYQDHKVVPRGFGSQFASKKIMGRGNLGEVADSVGGSEGIDYKELSELLRSLRKPGKKKQSSKTLEEVMAEFRQQMELSKEAWSHPRDPESFLDFIATTDKTRPGVQGALDAFMSTDEAEYMPDALREQLVDLGYTVKEPVTKDARDGDGDGLIYDGTARERPRFDSLADDVSTSVRRQRKNWNNWHNNLDKDRDVLEGVMRLEPDRRTSGGMTKSLGAASGSDVYLTYGEHTGSKYVIRQPDVSYMASVPWLEAAIASLSREMGVRTPAMHAVNLGNVERKGRPSEHDHRMAVIMEFVEGRSGRQVMNDHGTDLDPPIVDWDELLRSDSYRRLGIVDLITGQDDRHTSNFLVTDDGEVVPIDNAQFADQRSVQSSLYVLGRSHINEPATHFLRDVMYQRVDGEKYLKEMEKALIQVGDEIHGIERRMRAKGMRADSLRPDEEAPVDRWSKYHLNKWWENYYALKGALTAVIGLDPPGAIGAELGGGVSPATTSDEEWIVEQMKDGAESMLFRAGDAGVVNWRVKGSDPDTRPEWSVRWDD